MVSDDEKVIKIAQFQKIMRDDKKQQARKDKEALAAANRIRFGRTGHEKKLSRRLSEKETKAHDALRREPPRSVPDRSDKSSDEQDK